MIKCICRVDASNKITEIIYQTINTTFQKDFIVTDILGEEASSIIELSRIHSDIEQKRIKDTTYVVSFPYKDEVLVMVLELCEEQGINEMVLLLSSVRDFYDKFKGNTYNTLVFEEIQKLNNELVNKNREIAKISHKLKNMNELLSSRLIKDPLTDLVSRYQYADEIEGAINRYPDNAAFFVFIDIDNFKAVNDTYGHRVGDQYLIEFANRLKKLPLSNVVKLRISGDEFGLFVYGIDHLDAMYFDMFWHMFQDNVLYPITLEGVDLSLEVSLGIAQYKIDAIHINEMIDYADFAMYQAKHSGKNKYCLFNKEEYLTRQEK